MRRMVNKIKLIFKLFGMSLLLPVVYVFAPLSLWLDYTDSMRSVVKDILN
jgi:hypothetical protein